MRTAMPQSLLSWLGFYWQCLGSYKDAENQPPNEYTVAEAQFL